MTATIDHSGTTARTFEDETELGTSHLLRILEDAVAAVADVDPDELHSWCPVGRELLGLAGLARAATAGPGGDPVTAPTGVPGVVVVRELVAATRALGSVVAGTQRR